jgi:nitrogen regulatory protein PII 1
MILIQAIVRPEKAPVVMRALFEGGFPSITKMTVYGRGKQRGLKVGDITYDELTKSMLMIVVNDADKEYVIQTIVDNARTGTKGQFGDGKIFITPVEEAWTISKGIKEL